MRVLGTCMRAGVSAIAIRTLMRAKAAGRQGALRRRVGAMSPPSAVVVFGVVVCSVQRLALSAEGVYRKPLRTMVHKYKYMVLRLWNACRAWPSLTLVESF